jgi:hypothetical protein
MHLFDETPTVDLQDLAHVDTGHRQRHVHLDDEFVVWRRRGVWRGPQPPAIPILGRPLWQPKRIDEATDGFAMCDVLRQHNLSTQLDSDHSGNSGQSRHNEPSLSM